MQASIYTIGHSNKPLETLLQSMLEEGITRLIDVRRFPASRRNPQFNSKSLDRALRRSGIEYVAMGESLGGHREPAARDAPDHPRLDTIGQAYATHMNSSEFRSAAQMLIETAEQTKACLMCAEHDPRRCHRSLIADYLTLQGVRVVHLFDGQARTEHAVHTGARMRENRIFYDTGAQIALEL